MSLLHWTRSIDEMPENPEVVLAQKFRFGVEVLQFARFRNETGACVYLFEPFLSDLGSDGSDQPEAKAVQDTTVPSRRSRVG